MADASQTKALVKKLIRRLIRWAVTESGSTDDGAYQTQLVSYLRRPGSKSATIYPWGYNALAPSDVLSILLSISGQSDARVHMPISGPDRFKVKPAENVVYNPITQDHVYFKEDGTIEVVSSKTVSVLAPTILLTAGSSIVLDPGTGTTVNDGNAATIGDHSILGSLTVVGEFDHNGSKVGFYGETPVTKPTITGARNSDALTVLLTKLETMGFLADSTSA